MFLRSKTNRRGIFSDQSTRHGVWVVSLWRSLGAVSIPSSFFPRTEQEVQGKGAAWSQASRDPRGQEVRFHWRNSKESQSCRREPGQSTWERFGEGFQAQRQLRQKSGWDTISNGGEKGWGAWQVSEAPESRTWPGTFCLFLASHQGRLPASVWEKAHSPALRQPGHGCPHPEKQYSVWASSLTFFSSHWKEHQTWAGETVTRQVWL